MRSITSKAVRAFYAQRNWSQANSEVKHCPFENETIMFLHGNPIARLLDSNKLEVCTAGWDTKTTKDRLNALINVSVGHSKGVLYLNDKVWANHQNWTKV